DDGAVGSAMDRRRVDRIGQPFATDQLTGRSQALAEGDVIVAPSEGGLVRVAIDHEHVFHRAPFTPWVQWSAPVVKDVGSACADSTSGRAWVRGASAPGPGRRAR